MENTAAERAEAERPQTRATVVIDRDVHRLVKIAAAHEGKGLTEYLNDVLRQVAGPEETEAEAGK